MVSPRGPTRVLSVVVFRLLPLAICAACASSAPATSGPGKLASGWLSDVRAGDDPKARAQLGMPPGGPTDFDLEKFTKRVDRLPLLRDHESVEWTSLKWSEPDYWRRGDPLGSIVVRGIQRLDRTATLCGVLHEGEETAEICMGVRRGRLWNVQVRGQYLVPRHNYHVIPAPPPLDEPPPMRDIAVEWSESFGQHAVRVHGELEVAGGYGWRLATRCLEGDRFYDHATTGSRPARQGWAPAEFSSVVGPNLPEHCEVEMRISQQQTRRQTWCLRDEAFTVGPCPEQPVPGRTGPHGVSVDQVSMDLDGRGATVHFTVYPNDPMPEPGPSDSATLWTTVDCASGDLQPHARPLTERDHPQGVHRRVGSVFIEDRDRELVPPCTVRLRYVRDDDYDREEAELYEGCFDGEELAPGTCG